MLIIVRSILITFVAALLAFAIGAYCGSAFGYFIAFVSNRDPAELKDMLIWCMIGTAVVFSTATIWGAALFFSARRWMTLAAGTLFCLITLGSIGITILAFIEAPRYNSR